MKTNCLILADKFVNLPILPLSFSVFYIMLMHLFVCIFVCFWEKQHRKQWVTPFLNATELAAVDLLSHFISFTYEN